MDKIKAKIECMIKTNNDYVYIKRR